MRDIVIGKLVNHTINDDYEDLSERLFGEGNCYNSSEVRKRMYGMKAIIDAIERDGESSILNEDILSVIDEKKVELQKERQKFFDQRREFNKAVAADARSEHLYASLIEAANNLEQNIGKIYDDNVHLCSINSKNEAVLVFSDWHYGMKTQNVFNSYNTEICKQRVRDVVQCAIEKIQLHRCSKLHIVVLGDLWHGAIHVGTRVASEELVCDQIMQVSEILAQSIERLSLYVEETTVYVTYGNHARTIQNKNDSIHRDNIERIVPWWLSQRLQGYDNISVTEDTGNEFLFVNACGHELCASHGDLDSVKSSPRLLTTLFQKKYGKDIEYILLGDKHHIESFEELGVCSIMCGSLCGSDDYANSKRLFSTPSQLLLIVNKESGVDAEYRIRLT